MTPWDHYRSRAFWCLESAQNTSDRVKKGRFIKQALNYLRLAEKAYNNSQADGGYDKPLRMRDKSRRERI
jgi:hypothetical protein